MGNISNNMWCRKCTSLCNNWLIYYPRFHCISLSYPQNKNWISRIRLWQWKGYMYIITPVSYTSNRDKHAYVFRKTIKARGVMPILLKFSHICRHQGNGNDLKQIPLLAQINVDFGLRENFEFNKYYRNNTRSLVSILGEIFCF